MHMCNVDGGSLVNKHVLNYFTAWERNLNEINKQFFKKLAISMKARQRNILYGLYGSMQEMFQEMNTIIQERQGTLKEYQSYIIQLFLYPPPKHFFVQLAILSDSQINS